MTNEPTNVVVACVGRKGQGKSLLLYRMYTSKKNRVLSLGLLPQDLARDPDVIVVRGGLGPLLDRLKQAAHYDRWHIATELSEPDMAELAGLLVPERGTERRSLSEAFHGMALTINELWDYAPNKGTSAEVERLPRVGRHKLLDIYSAVQRPASCSRDFTAAADHLYLFPQSEGNDIDYLARTCGAAVAQLVATLKEREFVHYDRNAGGLAKQYDGRGRYVQTLSRVKSDGTNGQKSDAPAPLAG